MQKTPTQSLYAWRALTDGAGVPYSLKENNAEST
ncbi:hypothetical protein LAUMK142_00448 [Mycobacterium pseudokansasii]|uniref:Uncharacterized protein n=1 Tax=Mycobacterium pseudokansasii TaxID=2341080 RepID=A0A498QLL2_9MYCO|nr:hypothetical protein LAUMK142_00448 [Mycobacterium pseudokansasii]